MDSLFDESDNKFLNECPDFLDKNQELGLMSWKNWSREFKGGLIASLQQPSNDTYALDNRKAYSFVQSPGNYRTVKPIVQNFYIDAQKINEGISCVSNRVHSQKGTFRVTKQEHLAF